VAVFEYTERPDKHYDVGNPGPGGLEAEGRAVYNGGFVGHGICVPVVSLPSLFIDRPSPECQF